ncbi:MAG TPA: hypothetical protein ENK28_03145 [Aliiroseovarius sp.]|nr:hypothetical protein [Aliiroseovarius sp.]
MYSHRPLWRRTPPAIFPICLGVLGLGLGWRGAAEILPVASEIGDLFLGAGMAYYLYFLLFYLRKLAARPSALFDDMTTPPARAGIAAMGMSMMLLAAALLPFGISVPEVWWAGVIMQIAASAIVLHAFWVEPPERRHFSTFQYLTFVGPVVGPFAGIPLGYVWESVWLTIAALIPYIIITIGVAIKLMRKEIPVPLRPSLAIFVAPNCLFATSFGMLDFQLGYEVFYWIANISALVLLLRAPWMIKGGWSPVWASFTFPIAAFLNMQVLALHKGGGLPAEIGVWAALILGTPIITAIAWRTNMAWVTGELAQKTNAAKA